MTTSTPVFGGYVALSTSTTSQNKTDIVANLTRMLNLLQVEGPSNATTSAGQQPVYPDFDTMSIQAQQAMRNEINGLIAVINASP